MSNDPTLQWLNSPSRLTVTGQPALHLPANKPVLHRTVETAKVYEDIDYMPASPSDSGMYIYVNILYPLLRLPFSLFELYHSEVGINLRPKLYVTKSPLMGVVGTSFDTLKEAHRLVWVSDDQEAMRFVSFISSYVFKREKTKELFSVALAVLPLAYPDGGPVARGIRCTYLLPYGIRGGLSYDQLASAGSRYPIFTNSSHIDHTESAALRKVAGGMWP